MTSAAKCKHLMVTVPKRIFPFGFITLSVIALSVPVPDVDGHFSLHWFGESEGIRHVYIKPRTPELNGKVERSHRSDQEEFYQLLTYKDDVDRNKKLQAWEDFYNFSRPHGAFAGDTPYEVLRSLLH
jgi:hypothetical protein